MVDDMTKAIPNELKIVKDVFSHGKDHADYDSKLDRRMAIISFHNSIELFVRYAIISEKCPEKILYGEFKPKLDKLVEVLKDRPISNYPKILELNGLRNDIYHKYRIPSKDEVDEFYVITKLFLEECIKIMFDLDFDNISSFNLENVNNPFVKDTYTEAEKFFAEKDYESSASCFQKTFKEQWNSIYGHPINISKISKFDSQKNPILKDIEDIFNNLADDVNKGFKTIQNIIVKKKHLYFKKQIESVYHNYRSEKVDLKDLIKIKKIVEEFISETDDYISEEHLQKRIDDYRQMQHYKQMRLRMKIKTEVA
ncbi:hypothetical protein A2Z22_00705 [Candidatus Woesebacteria bacterium RBG_16_34_12]|uniref:Uncharacterized protein n=1 Tax=Candidatus Woesebacteria bacterium RBG_16_34_12 TaxID=1802480 RepID=A0A1F7X856_9BACT|nr:MAG: hypothetical protein A2Z22_00705 [Candidatus Woesebacteria bacterium RBG_16_34_12]